MSILSVSLLPISLALSPGSVVDHEIVKIELTSLSNEFINIECTEVVVAFEIGGVDNQTESASCADDLEPVIQVN